MPSIENPFNKRLPFSSLHLYWDDLPGPPRLRGKRLKTTPAACSNATSPESSKAMSLWREESHGLLDTAYPSASRAACCPWSAKPSTVTAATPANRRIVEGGYRLGHLLERIFGHAVSRGTK